MRNIEAIASDIQAALDEKDTVREIAIKSSRAIIRLSGTVVHNAHKKASTDKEMAEALDEAERLQGLLADHQEIWASGIVQDALQELAEAAIVLAIQRGDDLPEPAELNVPGQAYLMGFADAIGELRRFALESLRQGNVAAAEGHLDMMEEMFLVIMRFDYPDAIVSIRRKQDIARSVLEKTRGDVSVAVSSARLEGKISELNHNLEKRG
ncbi:MAG: Translin family protein [Methanomassiliicoccales archaeon PtaU1.Bin124]|nr:MAG: Translin family protein [Methanomassiliicoccales archaeon PtaU1.Bin124]